MASAPTVGRMFPGTRADSREHRWLGRRWFAETCDTPAAVTDRLRRSGCGASSCAPRWAAAVIGEWIATGDAVRAGRRPSCGGCGLPAPANPTAVPGPEAAPGRFARRGCGWDRRCAGEMRFVSGAVPTRADHRFGLLSASLQRREHAMVENIRWQTLGPRHRRAAQVLRGRGLRSYATKFQSPRRIA